MRSITRRFILCTIAALILAIVAPAQNDPASTPQAGTPQTSDSFRWIDFHSQSDQNIISWVRQSLFGGKWTAIREIGVVYDAALVVTSDRANPQAPPDDDSFSVYSVSLTSHVVAPLLTGVNLRWFERVHFADGGPEEWPVLYDNCRECAPNTYFTAFYYDLRTHTWGARWIRGGQGVPVWNADRAGVDWTQVYALLTSSEGHVALYTWNYIDHGKKKQPDDFIARYDVDSFSKLDRTVILTLKQAEAIKPQLCRGQDAVDGIQRGQDSALCQDILQEHGTRRPVTTPPANNRGQSAPGGRR